MIEKAVRLILQRLRAAKVVAEDQTDDEAERIIRATLKEVFVFVSLPKMTGAGPADPTGNYPAYPVTEGL